MKLSWHEVAECVPKGTSYRMRFFSPFHVSCCWHPTGWMIFTADFHSTARFCNTQMFSHHLCLVNICPLWPFSPANNRQRWNLVWSLVLRPAHFQGSTGCVTECVPIHSWCTAVLFINSQLYCLPEQSMPISFDLTVFRCFQPTNCHWLSITFNNLTLFQL